MKFVMAWEQLSPHIQKFKHSIMYNRLVPTGNQMWNLFDGKDVKIYIYAITAVILLHGSKSVANKKKFNASSLCSLEQ